MEILVYAVCFGVGMLFTALSVGCCLILGRRFPAQQDPDVAFDGSTPRDPSPGIRLTHPLWIALLIATFGGCGLILTQTDWISDSSYRIPLAILVAVLTATGLSSFLRRWESRDGLF